MKAVVFSALCILAGAGVGNLNATPIGTVSGIEGTGQAIRGGTTLDLFVGMEIASGDQIFTNAGSHVQLALLPDDFIYGLSLDSGRVQLKTFELRSCSPGKFTFLGIVRKAIEKTEEFIVKTPVDVTGVRGTDVMVGDPNPLSASFPVSVFDGQAKVDRIVWQSVNDIYFTDPLNKSSDTLDFDRLMGDVTGTTSGVDILGAGNAVVVNAGYYTTVPDGGTPTTPLLGAAPAHGGKCPDNLSTLFALGSIALGFAIFSSLSRTMARRVG